VFRRHKRSLQLASLKQLGRKESAFCDWHWRHSVICLTLPSLLVPHFHDVLTASTHTSYSQQPSDGTKDAASRPNPKVGSWSTSRQRPTRPGQRLSRHWTVTANIAVNCWRSLSRKVNCRQLSTANCTQLMMLLPNDWRHTACKCTRQQQQLLLLKWPIGTLNTAYSVTQLLSNIKTACNYKLQNCTYLPTFIHFNAIYQVNAVSQFPLCFFPHQVPEEKLWE